MRALTSAMQAQVIAASLKPILFVEVDTISGLSDDTQNVRVWSGWGTITWNGKTWVGVGEFGGISPIPETTEVVAGGIQLSLSGIPNDLINDAIAELSQGLSARVWFGCLDSSDAVIADPYEAFAGRVDLTQMQDDAKSSMITVSVENNLIDLQRPRVSRFTDQDHQSRYPGDRGFEFVPMLQQINLAWGVSGKTPLWSNAYSSLPTPPSP